MSFISRLSWVASLLAISASAQAQYVWIQPAENAQANSVEVRVGELLKPLSQLPALQEAKAINHDKASLELAQKANVFAITNAPATGDVRFTAVEPLADGIVYYHHAKLGRSETQAVNDLELVPTEANGNVFKLIWKGRPVAASLVNVDTSAGWRRQLTPNEDGSITMPTPFPALYVLEITVRIDDGSVTIDGKQYKDVRHNATLSFEVQP